MKRVLKYIAPALVVAGLWSCATQDSAPTLPNYDNSFPFASMVAIGNSLTAGFQSAALFVEGQNEAFPNMIARQVGLSDLSHVNVASPGISSTPGYGRYDLVFGASGAGLVQMPYDTVTYNPVPLLTNLDQATPYTNLGVPGALLQEALMTVDGASSVGAATGSPNSFFDFITRGIATQIQQALSLQPDLLTFWLGNNDVLGYATSGGVTPIGPYGADFATFYGLALDSLARNLPDSYIITANLPDVSSIPYVTYIPAVYNGMTLYGECTDGTRALVYGEDYVLLPAQNALPLGMGFTPDYPLTNDLVLDADEVATVSAAVAEYNGVIAATVAAMNANRTHPILLVDVNMFMADLVVNGYSTNGVHLSTDFITGGLFSLDGVHPSYAGYAALANEFIRVMNEGWELAIPQIDLGAYMDTQPTFGINPEDLIIPDDFGQRVSGIFTH